MSDLRDLTNEQLTDRNLHLGGQIDTIRNARLEIKRELDRRAELERAAQAIAGLPDEHRARALAAADPELAERVVQLAADLPAAPAQTLEPDGIESAEQLGEPGRRRWGRTSPRRSDG
jgi:hypothetical protein